MFSFDIWLVILVIISSQSKESTYGWMGAVAKNFDKMEFKKFLH